VIPLLNWTKPKKKKVRKLSQGRTVRKKKKNTLRAGEGEKKQEGGPKVKRGKCFRNNWSNGGRSKFQKNERILEGAFAKEPTTSRGQ